MTHNPTDDAIIFLDQLRPGGPWMLLAINPAGGTGAIEEVVTVDEVDAVNAFVAKHNGTRNLYYSLNPTRKPMTKKASKTDIAVIEYLPTDLDPTKDETPEDAKARYLAQIDNLAFAPAGLVDSGNGLNGLFKLATPIELPEPLLFTRNGKKVLDYDFAINAQIAALEAGAKRLMAQLGSAAGTQNIDRILRLPGTTNLPTKAKLKLGRTPCQSSLIAFTGATCTPEDFPAAPPAKSKTAAAKTELPQRLIELLNFMDRGAGEEYGKYQSRSGLLFGFLLKCIGANIAEDTFFAACLDDKYRGRAIYEHCHEQKNPPEYLNRQIEHAEEQHEEYQVAAVNRPPPFVDVAEQLLELLRTNGDDLLMVADEKGREHLWSYHDGLWSLLPEPDSFLNNQIEMMLQHLKLRKYSFIKFVSEARKYLMRSPLLRTNAPIVWDDHGKVPTRSGLVDPVTLAVEPLAKAHYATWRIEIAYDPTAQCPHWDELLDDYFISLTAEEAEKTIMLLQEVFGASVIDKLPKALKRALVLHGASDTGKSQLLAILAGMTTDHPIGTPLSEISKTHGMEEFTRRAPWVLDEAFDIGVWFISSLAKAIIARESLSINVKNQHLITMPICAPPFWGTNHAPTFKENTEAMINRLLIVSLTRIFQKGEYVGVAAKARAINPAWEPADLILGQEKAGLLNWALLGLQRLLARGDFIIPDASLDALDEMRLEANPVEGFLRDCIRFDPDVMMSTADFCIALNSWREESHGGEKTILDRRVIGKNLKALSHPRIGQDKNVFKARDGRRYYIGITLNAEGRVHFDEARTGWYRDGGGPLKGASISSKDVGKLIPAEWQDHPEVVKLKKWCADEA